MLAELFHTLDVCVVGLLGIGYHTPANLDGPSASRVDTTGAPERDRPAMGAPATPKSNLTELGFGFVDRRSDCFTLLLRIRRPVRSAEERSPT